MKKIIFLFSIFGAVISSCEQKPKDNYVIEGNIKGLKASYIYLERMQGDSSHIDSSKVIDGKFSFEGNMPEPAVAAITIKEPETGFRFILENAVIKITGDADSLGKLTITGSPTQKDMESYQASTKGLRLQSDSIMRLSEAAYEKNDIEAEKALKPQEKEINDKINLATQDYISKNPKSFASLLLLSGSAESMEPATIEKLFKGMDNSLQNSAAGKKMVSNLEIIKKTSIGAPAMDFTQNDVNGKAVKLSDFKGKYVLLDFWASWCGPCREENPNVLKAYNQYKNKNFDILAVSLDEKDDDWRKAIKQDALPWTQVSDLKGWENEASQKYGVSGIPANFLIGPDGTIIAKNLRGEDLAKKLEEVLN